MDERKPEPPFHTLGGVIVYDCNGVVAECESRELAVLCSAAPDMLAALVALDAALCDGFDTQAARMTGRKALIAARAAVAKARHAHESSATQEDKS